MVLNQYFYTLNCLNQNNELNNKDYSVDPLINQKEH